MVGETDIKVSTYKRNWGPSSLVEVGDFLKEQTPGLMLILKIKEGISSAKQ